MVEPRDMIAAMAIKYEGDYDNLMNAIRRHAYLEDEEAIALLKRCRARYITMVDDDYPVWLKETPKAPVVLFYYGNINLILHAEDRIVAYIGSRDASPYGIESAQYFAQEIAKQGYVLINGMARGIDSISAEAALLARGKVVVVLGSGIDNPYPSSSKDLYARLKVEGLVLSEYPGYAEPEAKHFPMRNRIVAGLARLVIVGEAERMSGTLITVGFATNMDRPVACVPYPCRQESTCNALIRDGAFILDDALDLQVLMSGKKTLTQKGRKIL